MTSSAKKADAQTAGARTMKVPSNTRFRTRRNLALKHRKAAAAKKKESEKREIEASSRKNLAGVRVVQKNLVYVIGLNPTIRDESQLLQTLRGKEYFGQYGDIEKIVVSKAKPGGNQHQGIGVYVTFSRKADAATCIAAVDGSPNGDRVLRAQYGTTKYCSSFLRNEQCNNRNCTFLHETGEDSESYSRSDLSSMNTLSSQRQQTPNTIPSRSAQPITHTMRRQPSKDDSVSGRSAVPDGPALPSSASWANKDVTIKARRPSLTGSQASQSPRPASVNVSTLADDAKRTERPSPIAQESRVSQPEAPSPTSRAEPRATKPRSRLTSPLDLVVKNLTSPDFKFVFSASELSDDEVKAIGHFASVLDPYGGLKRRAMRESAEQERLNREQELLQNAAAEEDSREAGSLQLGGEPEDVNPPRGSQSRESHGAIQPPSQQGTADNSTVGSPVSASSIQFQGLNLAAGRSLTPLQQQQLMLLKSAGNQQAGLSDPMSSAALDQAAQARQSALQGQLAQYNALQAQSRQSSRFSFAQDASTKNLNNARMLGQMQPGTPNPLTAPSPQHALSSGFYASGVQGPPPGLKTAGTPPISGGGMFAQGHGFTANANVGIGKQDATPELMRELFRGRGATSVGSAQGQDASKREFMFPFLQQHQTPPPLNPVNGLLSSFYGPQAGSTPDSGGSQKQKKKGKKQRHANTSSGGGGVVDLADPSILQARMHQVGANATAGQALYGSQGQGGYNPSMVYGGNFSRCFANHGFEVDEEFPPLGSQSKENQSVDTFGFLRSQISNEASGRAGTPSVPPGLSLPRGHPASAFQQQRDPSKPSSPAPLFPPGLSALSREGSPSQSRSISPETNTRTGSSLRSKDAFQISLGSPVAKSTRKPRLNTKLDLTAASAPGEKDVFKTESPMITKASPVGPQMPSSAVDGPSARSEGQSPGTFPPGPGSVSAISSRPNTPLTTASRLSDASAPRQPRILRVVETPKPDAAAPVAKAPSIATSTTGQMKYGSRRQSLSSASRPDSPPGDLSWEADTFASASRTNSPPPANRIGSAPVRAMTKSQAKKERRQKAKEAEAKKAEVAATSEEPVQAPIIGRKRKTKKATSIASDPAVLAPSPVDKASPVKSEKEPPQSAELNAESSQTSKPKEEPAPDPKGTTMLKPRLNEVKNQRPRP
ncbi:hypothetical protein N7470_004075 [Penicillium chermesinum]|nr:hypothetical protein N7470_004075 [Penicillium chermesinum]